MNEAALLSELLRRESRSFLQYVHESYPWAHGTSEAVRAKVLGMADAEEQALEQLSRTLQRKRIPIPAFGAYLSAFMHFNYMTISSLRPKLIADLKQGLADLDRDLFAISDAAIRAQLEAYRDMKGKHLAELEALS